MTEYHASYGKQKADSDFDKVQSEMDIHASAAAEGHNDNFPPVFVVFPLLDFFFFDIARHYTPQKQP